VLKFYERNHDTELYIRRNGGAEFVFEGANKQTSKLNALIDYKEG